MRKKVLPDVLNGFLSAPGGKYFTVSLYVEYKSVGYCSG